MNFLIRTIDGIQEILGICPCCGEIFRLVEGKFVFPKKPVKSCEYLDMVALEKKVAVEEDRLSRAEERFQDKLDLQQERLAKKGQRKAKRKLKKIDPVFSARDIDPQDVKVIFHPVEYVVFHGLNSQRGLSHLEFISRQPESKLQEVTTRSIERTIKNGEVSFETLRLKDDGSFDVRKVQ
jgi:predicted Holliday junction resolvase-like endonuclease